VGKIDWMIGGMRCVWHCDGPELIAWPGIGADGARAAASGTWPHDQHGLQRSGAKQDGTGGEHKQSQLRSVFVGHGSRG
jgi:hypothetical protein